MQFDTIILDELTPDSSDYEHDGLAQAVNAVPVQSAWREIKGRNLLAVSLLDVGEKPLTAFSSYQAPAGSGDPIGYAATNTRLWGYSNNPPFGPGAFTDMSKGGVRYASTPSWAFTKFGGSVIAASAAFGVPLQVRQPLALGFTDLVTSVDRPAPTILGVVRSVVVGANLVNGGAGVYAGVIDPQEFVWSARNDATNWQVDGLNGAGFGYLKGPAGPINGLATFQSYALAFQAFAVVRLDYTGDSNGFQPSEIGAGGLGIPTRAWGSSAVKAGGDTFYFGGVGPCVVYNGETCQILGGSKVRRYLSDMMSDYGADSSTSIQGSYDPWLGAVIWTIKPKKSGAGDVRILVVTEIKHGSYDAYTVRFSPEEGRWATIEPGLSTYGLFHDLSGASAVTPLSNLYMVEYDFGSNTMRMGCFNGASSLPITLVSKIWHPLAANGAPIGSRQALLQGVRPVWGVDTNGDPVPNVSILIEWSNDPLMNKGVATLTVDMTTPNDDWFLVKANMPLVAGFFRFTVTIPSMTNAHLREFHGLELAFTPSAEP